MQGVEVLQYLAIIIGRSLSHTSKLSYVSDCLIDEEALQPSFGKLSKVGMLDSHCQESISWCRRSPQGACR